jgi:hypothetical protein
MKVPAGTQSGSVFRLRGKGSPDLRGYGHGDQLVRITVEVPSKLTARQRELLEEFARDTRKEVNPCQRLFDRWRCSADADTPPGSWSGGWLLCIAVALAAALKVTAPRNRRSPSRATRRSATRSTVPRSPPARDTSSPHGGRPTARVIYKTASPNTARTVPTTGTLGDLDELYPARRWVQVEALRGDAEVGLKHPVTAMQAWDIAWSVAGPQDRPKLRVRVERLAAQMTPQQLAEARRSVTSDELAALLDRQMAQAAAGQLEPAPGGGGSCGCAGRSHRDGRTTTDVPAPPQPEAVVEIDVEPGLNRRWRRFSLRPCPGAGHHGARTEFGPRQCR